MKGISPQRLEEGLRLLGKEHGYPKALSDIITSGMMRRAAKLGFEKIMSVLLMGSGARGEFSFIFADKKLVILSDFEGFFILRTPYLRKRYKFRDEDDYFVLKNRVPLYYLDFGSVGALRLLRQSRTLWSFEAKQSSRILAGRDMRFMLPRVSVTNIDLGNLNEILLVRLWAVMVGVPKGCIRGNGKRASKLEQHIFAYNLSRNVLDIPTVILPQVGILISGYRPRRRAWSDAIEAGLLGGYFDKNDVELIDQALRIKESRDFVSIKHVDFFRRVLCSFEQAIRFVVSRYCGKSLKWEQVKDNLLQERVKFNSKLNGKLMRRIILDIQAARRSEELDLTCARSMAWIASEKRGRLLLAMLSFQRVLLYWLQGDGPAARNALGQSEYLFSEVFPSVGWRLADETDIEEYWLLRREDVAAAMSDWFYGAIDYKKARQLRMMRWSDDTSTDCIC